MPKVFCVNYIDDIDFVEKNGRLYHILLCEEYGALIPALDVANIVFASYTRLERGSCAPTVVRDIATYWAHIKTLQQFRKGDKTLSDVYFGHEQPCDKFPQKMEICDYKNLQQLYDARTKMLTNQNSMPKKIQDYREQVQGLSIILEVLDETNKKYGFNVSSVSTEEYDKLLKEVEKYRQFFAKNLEIRRQLGITPNA